MTQFLRILPLAALAALMGVTPAKATLTVIFDGTNNGTTITGGSTPCVDNTACDLNPAANAILTSYAGASFTIDGVSNFAIGSNGNGNATINGLTLNVTGVPTAIGSPVLTVAISQDGFTLPPTPLVLTQSLGNQSAAGTGPTGTSSAQGFFAAGPAPSLFDTSGASTGVATGTFDPAANSAVSSFSGAINGATPYALTSFFTLNVTDLGAGGTVNFNGTLTAAPVPEPATVSLLGGVLLLGAAALRRKRRNA